VDAAAVRADVSGMRLAHAVVEAMITTFD